MIFVRMGIVEKKVIPVEMSTMMHQDGNFPITLYYSSECSIRQGNNSLQNTGGHPDDWRIKLAVTVMAIKTSLESAVMLSSKILAIWLSDLASVRNEQVFRKAMSISGHDDQILLQHCRCPQCGAIMPLQGKTMVIQTL